MNFTRFLGSSTNIFPIANSKTGGQLLTEFNLRSRESVTTNPNVKYHIGPSCCHSMDDFKVRLLEDELGTVISTTTLEITSGRALVNGHYLESLTNVTIDLSEANNKLKSEKQVPLKGKLAIGLRSMYSTEQTLAATLLVENNQNFMEGMQLVILPIGKVEDGYFVLPEDSPDNSDLVTAHLKLAEFYFVNGNIRTIIQNENKIQYLSADRIGNFDSLLSGTYVTRNGLNPKKLYTMSGKSTNPDSKCTLCGGTLKDHEKSCKYYGHDTSKHDTWCDSTDSLFIWQKASDLKETLDPQLPQAEFGVDTNDYVNLTLPHKEVDGMVNTEGQKVHYKPRIMNLPKANWSNNTAGTVDRNYTKSVKSIKEKLNEYYTLPNGKQRGYLEEISSEERTELPTINPAWNIGDYILVCTDNSVSQSSDLIKAPSTFYSVMPPVVTKVEYVETRSDSKIPDGFNGVEIHREVNEFATSDEFNLDNVLSQLSILYANEEDYNERLGIDSSGYRGQMPTQSHPEWLQDYICVRCSNVQTPRKFADKVDGEAKNVLSEMEQLSLDIHEKENEISSINSDIDKLKDAIVNYEKDMSQISMDIKDYQFAFSANEDKWDDNQKEQVLNKIDELRSNYDKILSQKNENETELDKHKASLTRLQTELKPLTDIISPSNIVIRDWNAYYKVSETNNKLEYSEPNILTGPIPLATIDRIGGFLNVEDTDVDNGYIFRDDDGHLRLLDYSLLRSGVLAYQLGQDLNFGSGLSTEELQIELDEYVNERVAFPTVEQQLNAENPNVINIVLDLPEETVYSNVNIQNIDSRWGTSVWLHVTGSANDYTTINIINCDKIRVSLESGSPNINIYNSCVYYDSSLLEKVLSCNRINKTQASMPTFDATYGGNIYDDSFTGIQNISFWYQKFNEDDANLIVDGMTVTETDTPIIPEDVDFWSESVINDNHYYFGLQSLTFAPNGILVGCGLYMRNDMTSNIELTKTVAVSEFKLPQGTNFAYPESSLRYQIKIDGQFTNAYSSDKPDGYITMSTSFTALTQQYNDFETTGKEDVKGTISFLSDAQLIEHYIGVDSGTPIDGWENNSYHVFKGYSIG